MRPFYRTNCAVLEILSLHAILWVDNPPHLIALQIFVQLVFIIWSSVYMFAKLCTLSVRKSRNISVPAEIFLFAVRVWAAWLDAHKLPMKAYNQSACDSIQHLGLEKKNLCILHYFLLFISVFFQIFFSHFQYNNNP